MLGGRGEDGRGSEGVRQQHTMKRERKRNKEQTPAGLMRGRTRGIGIKKEYASTQHKRLATKKSKSKRNEERG